MKTNILAITLISCLTLSCANNSEKDVPKEAIIEYQNKGHELVAKMMKKVGGYKLLREKEDVIFTYIYTKPNGKVNQSTEKYIFDGELSYGDYHQHEVYFPELEGRIEMGYDGHEFWLKHNGTVLNDSNRLKKVAFVRPTKFYWFTMLQKLQDPGLSYEYLKEEKIDNIMYDIVKISFDAKDNQPTDIYHLYINRETQLIDQFLFTVAQLGKTEPMLLKMEYEKIDGLLIPTKRKYKKSDWDANVTDEPWILVNWKDIKFNNNLSKEEFKK